MQGDGQRCLCFPQAQPGMPCLTIGAVTPGLEFSANFQQTMGPACLLQPLSHPVHGKAFGNATQVQLYPAGLPQGGALCIPLHAVPAAVLARPCNGCRAGHATRVGHLWLGTGAKTPDLHQRAQTGVVCSAAGRMPVRCCINDLGQRLRQAQRAASGRTVPFGEHRVMCPVAHFCHDLGQRLFYQLLGLRQRPKVCIHQSQ